MEPPGLTLLAFVGSNSHDPHRGNPIVVTGNGFPSERVGLRAVPPDGLEFDILETYAKPTLRAIAEDVGSSGCNFCFNNTSGQQCDIAAINDILNRPVSVTGPCITVDPGQTNVTVPANPNPEAVFTNTIVGVNDNGFRVTPLANTGLPGTQHINVGVPVGTRGIYADLSLTHGQYAINRDSFGVDALGQTVLIGLPRVSIGNIGHILP
jgi:hypothetical protein